MSEMVEVLETVYVMEGLMSGNMARERAKQIFDELDIDGDGTLTCDEFVNGCLKDKDMVAMLKQSNTPPTTDQE
jgi:Ca2+-binding EF-hand superfamily protein